MSFSFKQLQEENKVWVAKNFGETTPDLAWRPLMGMCEELSELMVAKDRAEIEDCVADFVIFLSDYCNARGYDLEQLWEGRASFSEEVSAYDHFERRLLHMIGKAQHHHLKAYQQIRGSDELHKVAAGQLLSDILEELNVYLSVKSQRTVLEVVERTWLVVRERDWNKHRKEANAEGK